MSAAWNGWARAREQTEFRAGRARILAAAAALAALLASGCDWTVAPNEAGWLLGYWVRSYSHAPYTDLLEYSEDGSRYRYDDYAGTVLVRTAAWSLDGDMLTVDGESAQVEKITDDNFLYKGFLYFRKGTEPGGNVFLQTATELTRGDWLSGSLVLQSMKLFSFTASSGGLYEIQWDDRFDGSGSTTSDIVVSVYQADRSTPFFTEMDDGYEDGAVVLLAAGEKTYIIVEACCEGGTFRIAVK